MGAVGGDVAVSAAPAGLELLARCRDWRMARSSASPSRASVSVGSFARAAAKARSASARRPRELRVNASC